MNSKERLLAAWTFNEPDRVPIEMFLSPSAEGLPGSDEIRAFQENEADNFRVVCGFDWGFMGIETRYAEEIIEDVPGEYKRMRRTHVTPAGDFTAVTRHEYEDLYGEGDPGDFQWEKRFIETLDDFRRVAEAPRGRRPFDLEAYNRRCSDIGNSGLPITGLFHPLGTLVRNSNMIESYMWIISEEEIVENFLSRCTSQLCESILGIKDATLVSSLIFKTYALEMLIPPWLGKRHFEKLVFPYDKQVNDAIHAIGGKNFAHCHGNSGAFLERFADMGVDAVDPLEPPPYGDNILADAKKRVGKRMMLCGNVPSQSFALESFKVGDVREMVRRAIEVGAPGGGFALRTTGSAHVGNGKTNAQKIKSIQCGLAMIEAWREFGKY